MKSTTDIHWNTRAQTVKNDLEVNIMDIFQRNLEYDAICPFITPKMDILEIGCGNGYSTSVFRKLAKHVDSFDYSEEMIQRARKTFKETNNRFFVDNVLTPKHIDKKYDMVICVRVLINLRNLEEQRLALKNITNFIKDNGLCILVEGYKDGFEELNIIRNKVKLPKIKPAKINFYSSLKDLMPLIKRNFGITHEIHLGSYDYLTRFVYPCLVGQENVTHNTNYHEKAYSLARAYNPGSFKNLSRIRGFVLKKR
jgi:SAM-dependent methyltransferase